MDAKKTLGARAIRRGTQIYSKNVGGRLETQRHSHLGRLHISFSAALFNAVVNLLDTRLLANGVRNILHEHLRGNAFRHNDGDNDRSILDTDDNFDKSSFYLLVYPLFFYTWIPIIFVGFIHRNEHEWAHTHHTRSMNYEQMKREEGRG